MASGASTLAVGCLGPDGCKACGCGQEAWILGPGAESLWSHFTKNLEPKFLGPEWLKGL